jgi:hypothetical protein
MAISLWLNRQHAYECVEGESHLARGERGAEMPRKVTHVSRDFLRTHVGADLKFLAVAAVHYAPGKSQEAEVAWLYSALSHARALLDFFTRSRFKTNAYVLGCYTDPTVPQPLLPDADRWNEFISARVVHVGFSRDRVEDLMPGGKSFTSNAATLRLANLLIDLAELNVPLVNDDCRPTLACMVERARAYLADPEGIRPDGLTNLDAMDPSHLD